MTAPRILALDFGQKLGWASNCGMRICGTMKLPAKKREAAYVHFLMQAVRHYRPEIIVYENIPTIHIHASAAAAHWWGYYYHQMQYVCTGLGIRTVSVTPPELKRFATGKGRAPKDVMIAASKKYGFHPPDDNAADASLLLVFAEHLI